MNEQDDNQLLVLSQEMLASAEINDWEKVTELAQIRLPIFNRVFADGINDNEELAREILILDEKTTELAKAGLSLVKNDLLKMKDCVTANNAYRSIQNST